MVSAPKIISISNGTSISGNSEVTHSQNPEPATFILFGLGLLGAAGIGRRSGTDRRVTSR